MADAPEKVVIRTYQVGFGDCFLLSFQYANGERHVLIDFGSTGVPKPVKLAERMMAIAKDIKERTNGKLHAVVATHRHKDHISGFATKAGGKGTGDVIRALKPDLVVQPWTEHPKLGTSATGPKNGGLGEGAGSHVVALGLMQHIAASTLREAKSPRYRGSPLGQQLSFLGESNIANPSAVKNLMSMAKNDYVHAGKPTALSKVLPGVTIDVLGPPTVEQTDTIKKQKSRDPDEFWHLQARAMDAADGQKGGGKGKEKALFPKHVRSRGPAFPIDTRWLIYHAKTTRAAQVLQIVRMLDKAMNNTSVILAFQVGETRLLFPGDAQIENWQYALNLEDKKTKKKRYEELLKRIDLYKVGHHGSLNATPKSLWKLFDNKSTDKAAAQRLQSLMSTMEHKHGDEDSRTEVPRKTLVSELQRNSNLFSTQELSGGKFYKDTVLDFSRPAAGPAPRRRRKPTHRPPQ